MQRVRKLLIGLLLLVAGATAAETPLDAARSLYLRTEYGAALEHLRTLPRTDAGALLLTGQCHYMLGNYKRASEALEQAAKLTPANADVWLWLGRAYGRRAETSSFLTAPGLARKARDSFERAVALNPSSREAVGDLVDYYLEAPGFLGGGIQKATALAERLRDSDPAEYHYLMSRVADRRKDAAGAEEHLRRAMQLAPRQLGRVIDLAKFLARHRRYQESDELFRQAAGIDPENHHLMFERAKAYIEARRNLDEARDLLARYLRANLSPDDPPRSEAERLLRKAQSS